MALVGLLFIGNVQAQPLVNIDTVAVGDPGNAADTTGYGAVTNVFAIGKYEVTIGEYTVFLNSVASVTTDNHIADLWSPSMEIDSQTAGISRFGAGTLNDPYVYSEIGPFGAAPVGASSPSRRPIAHMSWLRAARFANWLHNGATNGASTETGAYSLNGATSGVFPKSANARWWIPSEDEWYKAAYYKGTGPDAGYWLYPTQSDEPPSNVIGDALNQANTRTESGSAVTQSTNNSAYPQNRLTEVGAFSGSLSPYGTFDQGGNLWELVQALSDDACVRGGAYGNSIGVPGGPTSTASWRRLQVGVSFPPNWLVGFRVAGLANNSRTGAVLTLEKSSDLAKSWVTTLITTNMITAEGELNVGEVTNGSEFYRLRVRTTKEE